MRYSLTYSVPSQLPVQQYSHPCLLALEAVLEVAKLKASVVPGCRMRAPSAETS